MAFSGSKVILENKEKNRVKIMNLKVKQIMKLIIVKKKRIYMI